MGDTIRLSIFIVIGMAILVAAAVEWWRRRQYVERNKRFFPD
jgi:hypothetical protein